MQEKQAADDDARPAMVLVLAWTTSDAELAG